MRRDVKLGIVLSMLFVLGFGGYYVLRDQRPAPIAVADAKGKEPGDGSKNRSQQVSPANKPAGKPATESRTAANQPPRNTPANQPRRVTNSTQPPAVNQGNTRTAAGTPRDPAVPATATDRPSQPGATPGSTTPGTNDSRVASVPAGAPAGSALPTQPNRPMSVPGDGNSTGGKSGNPAITANNPTNTEVNPTTTADASKNSAEKAQEVATPLNKDGDSGDPARLAGGTAPNAGMSSRLPAGGTAPSRSTEPVASAVKRDAGLDTANAAVETHRVQPGDTMASIAQAYYGSERYLPFLIQSNTSITDPARLSLGTLVKIPPKPTTVTDATTELSDVRPARGSVAGVVATGSRTYRVRHGDSFYAIARDVLGDASRWQELLALNNEMVKGDPTRLRIGQTVVLPES